MVIGSSTTAPATVSTTAPATAGCCYGPLAAFSLLARWIEGAAVETAP